MVKKLEFITNTNLCIHVYFGNLSYRIMLVCV